MSGQFLKSISRNNAPFMTAGIHHTCGVLEQMPADNRIFGMDWELYKQKLSGQLTGRDKALAQRRGNDAF